MKTLKEFSNKTPEEILFDEKLENEELSNPDLLAKTLHRVTVFLQKMFPSEDVAETKGKED